jgi:hypothetical protein
MFRQHELMLVQLASTIPQPRHERLAKKRGAGNRFPLTQRTGRTKDAVPTTCDEIARRHDQLFVGSNCRS